MSLAAPDILNREFLEIRCKVLELAAAFDRLDRADGSVAGDQRLARLREALALVQGDLPERAERVQLIFSRQYDDDWREAMEVRSQAD